MSKAIKVHSSQAVRLPPMQHQTVLIPSTSQPSWGGYSIFDIKEKGCSIHEITIKLNISPITGLTGTQANFPNYNPSFFFLQRLEVVINNNILDTIYPEEQWLRNQLFEYDEVLNYQRQAIYSERRRILESDNLRNWILQYAETTITDYFSNYIEKGSFNSEEQDRLLNKVESLLGLPYEIDRYSFAKYSEIEMKNFLIRQTRIAYDLKESQIDLIENGLMRELERSFLLQKIDSAWKEHLQQINTLRENIGWRGYGQKDPLIEYKNEAYNLFLSMTTNIRHSVVYLIFRSQPILKV